MKKIINGGLYNVVFEGARSSEFNGGHPTLVIRTLKEKELYFAIPLTTYTKEKWNKIKRVGFGKQIESTNSIARIDKMQVIHESDIRNRWSDTSGITKIEPTDLVLLNNKILEYLKLSNENVENEYNKYCQQYDFIYANIKNILNSTVDIENNIFEFQSFGGKMKLQSEIYNFSLLSIADIKEIIKKITGHRYCEVSKDNNKIVILLKK